MDEESIFDWAETYVVIDYGFSPEFSFTLYADFHEDGDDWYGFGFEFLWGDLSVFGPEWWKRMLQPLVELVLPESASLGRAHAGVKPIADLGEHL